MDWTTILHDLLSGSIVAVATIATIKADVKWLKRWTREHANTDDKNFETVNGRLGRLEDHLLR